MTCKVSGKEKTKKGVNAMKAVINVCVVGAILICAVGAQDLQKPALREGISVQMPVAKHAVEMRAADDQDAMVVAITADGRVFAGITPTEPGALSGMVPETVYVKADSRAPFQKVLAVLDALRGKSVVLLAEPPPASGARGEVTPPYGLKLTVFR
jgi:biopolymer transport protein ExbD